MEKKRGKKRRSFHEIKRTIWQVQIDELSWWRAWGVRLLRILLLTKQGFTKSQIQHGASALTYYTLLAIVPILALLIGISRGFLFETTFEEWLVSQFSEQKEVINKIFDFAALSLKRVKGGWIALIGIAILLWSAIKILLNLEWVMNGIWEVRRGRPFARRFSDYLAVIFIFPIILFVSSGLSVYLTAGVRALAGKDFLLREIGPVLLIFLHFIPFFLITLMLTFLYIFMPNTRVRFLPALIAAFTTAIIYEIVEELYFAFQVGAARYNAVYGTFAALPLFLIWVHISWLIILMGAKVAFSIQNVNAYEFITEGVKLNQRTRELLCLRIVHLCVQRFCEGAKAPKIIEISNTLSIPIQITGDLTFLLCNAGILNEVRSNGTESSLQPARDVDTLTIKSVIDMINASGEEIPIPPSKELNRIKKSLKSFSEALDASDANLLIKSI